MLALQKQIQYIQKAVQLPNGEWAIVIFELVERNGRIIAKAVSGKILEDLTFKQEKVLCLPCVKSSTQFLPIKSIFSNFVFNFSKDLSFVMSQPTRAPNFC